MCVSEKMIFFLKTDPMDIEKNQKSVNTGLYIGKGCFYYLLINNLLVGRC
jgi:hypothetical protein